MNDMAEPVRDCAFVVVAAGRGERAGAPHEGPKQYRPIGGKAVIRHTLEAILSWSRSGPVVVVIHPDDEALLVNAVAGMAGAARLTIVHGGPTRQHSVLYGLEALIAQEPRYVFIHDAVRPFVTSSFMDGIAGVLDAGAQAALPALAVPDTLKRAESGRIVATVDRAGLYAAQTPQAFVYAPILVAHQKAASAGDFSFTDDAAIAEWDGLDVSLAEGLAGNVKLTVKRDIDLADERLRRTMIADVRCGNGYDVHQLVPGNGGHAVWRLHSP